MCRRQRADGGGDLRQKFEGGDLGGLGLVATRMRVIVVERLHADEGRRGGETSWIRVVVVERLRRRRLEHGSLDRVDDG